LEGLSSLQTLLLASNRLHSAEDVSGVLACPTLTCLDLQNNNIEDPAVRLTSCWHGHSCFFVSAPCTHPFIRLSQVLEVLVQLPQLGVLYLQGNPCVKKIQHYRKVVIGRIPTLKYLDDRPVFEEERQRCDAWYAAFVSEGLSAAKAAEKAEMERQRKEKEERDERNFRGLPQCLLLWQVLQGVDMPVAVCEVSSV
jgi:dynein assembly factor 1, axonemal